MKREHDEIAATERDAKNVADTKAVLRELLARVDSRELSGLVVIYREQDGGEKCVCMGHYQVNPEDAIDVAEAVATLLSEWPGRE